MALTPSITETTAYSGQVTKQQRQLTTLRPAMPSRLRLEILGARSRWTVEAYSGDDGHVVVESTVLMTTALV